MDRVIDQWIGQALPRRAAARTHTRVRSSVAAGVAALAVATGMVAAAGPAAAAPACAKWTFVGPVIMDGSNGMQTKIDNWSGSGPVPSARNTHLINFKANPINVQDGSASGGIQGNKFDVTIAWLTPNGQPSDVSSHYTGTIGQWGNISGKMVDTNGGKTGFSDTFAVNDDFTCAQQAADPAPSPSTQSLNAVVIGGGATVFNIAHDDTPDPATGVQGAKLVTLPNGLPVTLDATWRCQKGWCRVNSSMIPDGFGFTEQSNLQIG
jgi:hypothetical protein